MTTRSSFIISSKWWEKSLSQQKLNNLKTKSTDSWSTFHLLWHSTTSISPLLIKLTFVIIFTQKISNPSGEKNSIKTKLNTFFGSFTSHFESFSSRTRWIPSEICVFYLVCSVTLSEKFTGNNESLRSIRLKLSKIWEPFPMSFLKYNKFGSASSVWKI